MFAVWLCPLTTLDVTEMSATDDGLAESLLPHPAMYMAAAAPTIQSTACVRRRRRISGGPLDAHGARRVVLARDPSDDRVRIGRADFPSSRRRTVRVRNRARPSTRRRTADGSSTRRATHSGG